MKQYALGRMGMTIQDFRNHTLQEYECRVRGFEMNRAIEQSDLRDMMFTVYKSQGAKIREPKQLFKIPLLDKAKFDEEVFDRLKQKMAEAKARDGNIS